MFSAGSLQTLDLLKSIIRVETECSKELPDYLLRQNFDIELSALPPEIFRRQLEGVSKFRGKECYFHKLEKQKAKKCWPRFLFRTCSHTHLFYFYQITHISFTSARSSLWQMQEVSSEGSHIFEKPRLILLDTLTLKSRRNISSVTVLKHLSWKQHLSSVL